MAARKKILGKQIENECMPKLPPMGAPEGEEEGDQEPCDQTCYQFNDALTPRDDNKKCRNCKKYLTTNCDQIENFIDEEGDVDEG